MRFSIITCTYNSENFLERNIDSVKKQEFSDFEHIFIDGFSEDKTLEFIQKYQREFPERVRLFQTQPKGISNAMNVGIERSMGDYVIHLHSDDSLYDNQILKDVDYFLSLQDVDWIYGKIQVTEIDGDPVGIFPKRKIWQKTRIEQRVYSYMLNFFNFIPHQSVFIRRQIFERFGYFDETLKSAMDPDLWLRIKDKTKWIFFDRIISNYCVRPDSQSASSKNAQLNSLNYESVQKRYLNRVELILANLINHFLNKRNNNLR